MAAAFLAASWYEKQRGAVGDGASERGRYDCVCDYLTDTDLAGEELVRVCADGVSEARKRARGCAQAHAPGSVDGCSCILSGQGDCQEDECRPNR